MPSPSKTRVSRITWSHEGLAWGHIDGIEQDVLVCVRLLAGVPLTVVDADSGSPSVKLSRTGICHEQGTDFYERTKHLQAFDSIDACLAAGGRRPKAPPQMNSEDANNQSIAKGDDYSSGSAEESDSDGWPWTGLLSICGILAVGGGIVACWRRHQQHDVFRKQNADERRRVEGHRLSRADREGEEQLLTACMGNREQMDRLVNYELSRDSEILRSTAVTRAQDRWRRDIHRSL